MRSGSPSVAAAAAPTNNAPEPPDAISAAGAPISSAMRRPAASKSSGRFTKRCAAAAMADMTASGIRLPP